MNEPEKVTTSDPTDAESQPQRREWVTPSFEQVALKDAFGKPTINANSDSVGGSS
jgi:hypothetical protein